MEERCQTHQRGMTLVEVVVAMTLVIVIFLLHLPPCCPPQNPLKTKACGNMRSMKRITYFPAFRAGIRKRH